MAELELDHLVLRYCRQIIMKTMDHVRSTMRGENRLHLKCAVADPQLQKSEQNQTKAIDRDAEDLIIDTLQRKFLKLPGIKAYTVFSEELGIKTFPEGTSEREADLVAFIDPIDGTEFIEALQGGWSLIAVYDRRSDEVIAAVAGDIFLDRIYWASKSGYPEGLDFITHSWFRLDGGPTPKTSLQGARINVLTTKVERYRALAEQTALLNALRDADGRVNLSWGSNTIIQVAAGYADVAVEFAKGFATYDILPGLYIGLKTGLTILDLSGNPMTSKLDLEDIFATFRRDPQRPKRMPFIAAKEPALADQVLKLLKKKQEPLSPTP
jgi:myo-inositol-1(or 4)-monophosphatase